MRCSNCGAEITGAMRFCPKCGTTVLPVAGPAASPPPAEGATPAPSQQASQPGAAPPPDRDPEARRSAGPAVPIDASAASGSIAAGGSTPPPAGPPQPSTTGGSNPNSKLVVAGVVAVGVVAVVLYLLLKGSGGDTDLSRNVSIPIVVPTVASSGGQATAVATSRSTTVATSPAAAVATSAPTVRPGGGGQSAAAGGKLADLNSYRFSLKIEGTGGPLADVASAFGALQSGSASANQNLVMEVTGAYVKPDKGQQSLKLGGFTIDMTTIGKQQWTKIFGIQTGPETASRSTEDYSFAATIWDDGLLDSFSVFACSGSETINGVATKKCGVDASALSSLIDAFGGLTGDPTSGIKTISKGNMQAWVAQQGNYPVRLAFDISGKGSDNKDFSLKMSMDVTDINSNSIKIDPPK